MKELIKSAQVGTRQAIGERWDLIPGGFDALSEVAKVANHGQTKHDKDWMPGRQPNWQHTDCAGEQSPINHGLRHAYKALDAPPGSPDRIWQLAKAAWNFLAAIWFEKQALNGGPDINSKPE